MDGNSQEFSGWRKVFWPIHSFELKRIIPLALMMACIIFTYSILRDVKDTLIVVSCGAEALPFIKLYGTLPFALLFMGLYTFLSDRVSRRTLFYGWVLAFTGFFLLFGFVLYPLRETLHASPETLAAWQEAFPRIKYISTLVAHWSYSLFYVMAELWGTVALGVLFWQLANDITKLEDAKRFYPPLILLGNAGFLCAGPFLLFTVVHFKDLPPDMQWAEALQWIMLAVTLSAGLLLYLYGWISKNGEITLPTKCPLKKKEKGSFLDNIAVVFRSKYLLLMAVLVISYGVSINLVEVTWKTQMKLQFPTKSSYIQAMGCFSTAFSIATVCLLIFGSSILRYLGWFRAALLTPVTMAITGSLFFATIVFRDALSPVFQWIGITPLMGAIFMGGLQIIMTKASKYSLFDSTKEMAYIPLDKDLRLKGKAAVDGVGDRLGKSGVGVIQQVMLVSILGATQLTIAPYLGVIFLIIVFAWLWAVQGLNKKFQKASKDR